MKNAAIGIIFSEDRKKILTVLRRDLPLWVLPGGGIEENETAEDAAQREVFEETGIQVSVKRAIGTYFPLNKLASTTYVFECIPVGTIPESLSPQEETKDIAFFPIDTLPDTFFFLHKEWIEDALQNVGPVYKPLRSVTWTKAFVFFCKHPFYAIRYLLSRVVL